MHRSIEITVPAATTDTVLEQLEAIPEVMGLSVQRGASRRPAGDVVTVHTLNRGADEVFRIAGCARRTGAVSVVTSQVSSIVDPEARATIRGDVDEALWEEVEADLHHHAHLTANYLLLMALGGALAGAGLVSGPVAGTIAFVAAAVIAPAFEPVAKIPFGLVLHRRPVVLQGIAALAAGYVVIALGGSLSYLLLRALGVADAGRLLADPGLHEALSPSTLNAVVSAAAAVAGILMITASRETLLPGPLMALGIVPAAALVGCALVAGRSGLIAEAIERLMLDVGLILLLSPVVVLAKQATRHRRAPGLR